MLTIRDYNKENLDRSSITIVDRYLSIIGDKEQEIDNIKNATLNLYSIVYWYINDARNKLKDLNDLIDEWEDKTGIDTTPIREETKHTENMVEAVEEITDDNYDSGDDTEEEIEEKAETIEENTEDIVEVIKENPEVKEEVKEEVKTEVTPTPSTPPTPTPVTPEEAKSDARQEAADSVRSRADDGREFSSEKDMGILNAVADAWEAVTGNPAIGTTDESATREGALNAAADVIANGGTAQEAVDAYINTIETLNESIENANTASGYNMYDTTDETKDTINQDIDAIIDAANEAASSESGSSGSDTPSCDEPSCDTPCDCCDADCDCCDSDSCDDSCCDSDCDCCDGDCDIPVCDTPIIDVDDI